MKQRTIVFDKADEMNTVALQLLNFIEENPHKKVLIQAVEPSGDIDYIKKGLEYAHIALPEITIIGMTSHCAMTHDTHAAKYPVVSVLLFEENDYTAFSYNCNMFTPKDVGLELCKELENIKDVKGILIMGSDITLTPQDFIDVVSAKYPNIPLFGALAGTSTLKSDESLVFHNNNVYERGMVIVVFHGPTLEITTHYSFGWKPLGNTFTVTESSSDGKVYKINDKPAVTVYNKYLGVPINEYFFENTAAFPFIFKHNNKLVARVALKHTVTSLQFGIEIPEGTKFSLAYAKANYLLDESLTCANKMKEFNPDAILIYACMSRRTLMGDELAEREFSYFKQVNPNVTWSCGYGELLFDEHGDGLLNGSLVAVGIKEGNKPVADTSPITDPRLQAEPNVIDLSDRLISFLESTTEDLNDNINLLANMASHDQLTKIYNRAALDYYYDELVHNISAFDTVAMIMFDIDHFKRVNDTFGHDVGDQVITGVVNTIKERLPDNAFFARWGGEEFMCLIPNCDKETAIDAAERIRLRVSVTDFTPVDQVTISIGVCLINKDIDKIESFAKVDKALYEAKETGRNKVVFSE